jgi:hypothetical protein
MTPGHGSRAKTALHMKKQIIIVLVTFCGSILCWAESNEPSLNPHLEPLRPLLGKTWKGTFKNSKPEKPIVDVARWERALNGQSVRMLHSINRGAYGGETIFFWDAERASVVYYYFTTAGFMTTGTMEVKEGKLVTHEEVKGDARGVTKVRGTSEILPDGTFHVKAEHWKNGEWEAGHEVTYQEAPSDEVVFK